MSLHYPILFFFQIGLSSSLSISSLAEPLKSSESAIFLIVTTCCCAAPWAMGCILAIIIPHQLLRLIIFLSKGIIINASVFSQKSCFVQTKKI